MATQHISNRFWKISGGLAGLIVVLAILVAVNILAGQFRARKDLTEEKLYTLAAGSRQVLSKLDRNVTLMFFFNGSSPEIPAPIKSFAREIEDLLKEYELAGNGRVTVERYDPKPDSDDEDLAMRFGVNPQAVSVGGGMLYLGLVAVSGDLQAAIPLIDPRTEQLLEYNITRMIYRVTTVQKPVVGILSSLPVNGTPPMGMMPPSQRMRQEPPWAAFAELGRDYTVRTVEPLAESIPGDIDTLIVVHPKDLGERTLFALDQFVLRGGRLLAFVDPLCAADQESAGMDQFGMGARRSSTLGKLFDAWGLAYDPGKVVADVEAMTPLRTRNNAVENNPYYLSLRRDNMAGNDILTAPLDSILMVMAGAFGNEAAEGLRLTPLIQTSDQAVQTDAMMLQFNPGAFKQELQKGRRTFNLAVRLEGKFRTAYPNGQPAAGETNAAPAATAALRESVKPGTVILVADADLLGNDFCVRDMGFFGLQQAINDNINLFANMVEQLAGSADLIGIRCRGSSQRPFTRVLALQAQAQEQWLEQEQMLEQRLGETQQRMQELQRSKDDKQRFVLSAEQGQELERFRAEVLKYKTDLKKVRRSLREGIEALGMKVKLINILLVPALVAAAGIALGIARKHSTR